MSRKLTTRPTLEEIDPTMHDLLAAHARLDNAEDALACAHEELEAARDAVKAAGLARHQAIMRATT